MNNNLLPLIPVENSLINKIVYLGRVPKNREVGDLWTPLHSVVSIIMLIGIVGLLIILMLEGGI